MLSNLDNDTNSALKQEVEVRQQTENELRRVNEELERKVIERTVELRNINEQLQFELTEIKRAEEDRLINLWFFESMDRVNRAIQETNDLNKMMNDVLQTVLSSFDCDRTWLFYPCDPNAALFQVPMEITKPEYPGAGILNVDIPMPPDMAQNLGEALESDSPITYITGTERPINKVSAEQFSVKSMMMIALYPKLGKPWAFGMHQCSYPRIWKQEEKRLFQEVGRRLSDALTSLLIYRDLCKNEEKYRRIVDTANEGIWVIDENHRTNFVNTRLTQLLGYAAEEMIGKKVESFIIDEDLSDSKKRMEAREAGISEQYERRWLCKNGGIVWTIVSAKPIFDAENHFQGSFAMITDITKRKQAEREIVRVNRMLRMLSDSNQALIHITDETTLLNEVCHIIVEVGGYCMAWVGFAEHDEAKTLNPIAHAGFDSKYLISENVTWVDNERGGGLGDTAIRTGHPCIVHNILSEPSFAPWRDAAIQRGYNSIISLPLICDGQTLGALGIYSVETDVFDVKEVEILKELAGDLAFGITTLRARVKHDKAEEQIKKALSEKETLLRELYHRTKNNMAVIISLLDLQAGNFSDPRLQEAFVESKNRIRTMALVHQKLYDTKDLSHINLKEYINDLIVLLMKSYSISNKASFVTEIEDVFVLLDTATPCGLILNELISNALKYAFSGNREGIIKIQLHKTKNGEIQIQVSDNGVGVPSGFDFRRDGNLGMQIIFIIVETQLYGKVVFDASKGVTCQIQFRDNLYKARV